MDPSDIQFGGSGETTEPVGEPASPEPSDSVAEGFLKGIPDGDRSIVEKYVKDWDGQVTKRFQSIHDQYKPYKELGDIEAIRKANETIAYLRDNPIEAYQTMREMLVDMYGPDFDKGEEVPGFSEELEGGEEQQPAFDPQSGIPDPVQQELAQYKQELEEMKAWRAQQEESATIAQQEAQLDNVLAEMHNQYGNFDDGWILLQLANGKDPQQAMQAWSEFTQSIVSSQRARPAPPIIGGQGGVPSSQVDVTKLQGQDRRKVVSQLLDLTNRQ